MDCYNFYFSQIRQIFDLFGASKIFKKLGSFTLSTSKAHRNLIIKLVHEFLASVCDSISDLFLYIYFDSCVVELFSNLIRVQKWLENLSIVSFLKSALNSFLCTIIS